MKTKPDDHHKKIRLHLNRRTNLAHSYHDIWAAIIGKGLIPHHLKELNDHYILAKSIELGMKQAFVVTLCSLYDADPRTISYATYADILRKQGTLPEEWEERHSKAKTLAQRLRILRNQHFAHDSLEKFSRNIWEDADLSYDELTELLQKSEDLTELLMFADDGNHYVYDFDPREDLRRIFPKFDPEGPWRQTLS